MNKKKTDKNSFLKGFTLIEILVSLGLLTMLLGTSIAALIGARQYSEESHGRLLAMDAARSVLETVKGTSLQQVPNIGLSSFVPSELKNGSISMTTSSATGNLAVDPVATVTVTVSWKGPRNMNETLELTTMRSKYN